MMIPADRRTKAIVLLGLSTLFWGMTFVYVKQGIAAMGVYPFLAYRFFLAGLIMQIIFIRRFRNTDRREFRNGMGLGILLAVSYFLQTFGLRSSTAVNAAFITGSFVVMVPFFSSRISKKPIHTGHYFGAFLSLAGLAILTGSGFTRPAFGDVLIFLCAVIFALYIVLIGGLKPGYDSIRLTVTQIYTVAFLSLILAIYHGDSLALPQGGDTWWSLLFCAIFATAFSYTVENHYQQALIDTLAALIYSLEPVFAALFAAVMIGEIITPSIAIGAAIILSAVMITIKTTYQET